MAILFAILVLFLALTLSIFIYVLIASYRCHVDLMSMEFSRNKIRFESALRAASKIGSKGKKRLLMNFMKKVPENLIIRALVLKYFGLSEKNYIQYMINNFLIINLILQPSKRILKNNSSEDIEKQLSECKYRRIIESFDFNDRFILICIFQLASFEAGFAGMLFRKALLPWMTENFKIQDYHPEMENGSSSKGGNDRIDGNVENKINVEPFNGVAASAAEWLPDAANENSMGFPRDAQENS